MQRRNIKQRVVTDEGYWLRFREEVRPIVREIVEEVVERKIEETRPKWADSVLSAADVAAGEYKKFDEEKTVLAGQISNHDEAIDDIDERVKKIEQKFGFA